jgi:hypothetical protein
MDTGAYVYDDSMAQGLTACDAAYFCPNWQITPHVGRYVPLEGGYAARVGCISPCAGYSRVAPTPRLTQLPVLQAVCLPSFGWRRYGWVC